MKHSPFAFFRRHQRVGMVILTVMAMFAFVFMDSIGKMANSGASARADQVAVKVRGGNLTAGELHNLVIQRGQINDFIAQIVVAVATADEEKKVSEQQLSQMVMGNQFGIEWPNDSIEENVVWGHIMRLEAQRLGLVVTDPMIDSYIRRMTDRKLTATQFQSSLKALGLGEKHVYDMFREELLARNAWMITRPMNDHTPEQYWRYYRQVKVRQNLEVAALPVREFAKSIKDPADSVIEKFFEEHKTRIPGRGPNFAVPGFRQVNKAQVQYLTANYEDIENTVPPVTDKEVTEYYEKNKNSLYRELDKPADMPTDDDPLNPELAPERPVAPPTPEATEPATEKPADTPAEKPADKPAAEKPDTEKPAEAKPEEKKSEEKPEEKKAEEPKPAEETKEKPCEDQPAEKTDAPAKSEEKPAAEKPAESKPVKEEAAAEKSAADKPAEEKAAEEKPADPKAKNGKPDASKPAKEKSDADGKDTTPDLEAEPIKYQPLTDALKENIRAQLLNNKTAEAIKKKGEEALKLLDGRYLSYNMPVAVSGKFAYIDLNDDGKLDDHEPSVESKTELNPEALDKIPADITAELKAKVNKVAAADLQAVGKKLGMKFSSTGLLTGKEINDTPGLGKVDDRGENEFQPTRGGSILEVLFGKEQLFNATVGQDEEKDLYVYWKSDFVKAHVPKLTDPGIKQLVIDAWKMQQAYPAAVKRAEDLAKLVGKQKLEVALKGQTVDNTKDGLALEVHETPDFSWMSPGIPSPNAMDTPPPVLTTVRWVEDADEEFMQVACEDLGIGESGVAPNRDHSVVYVMRVINREPKPGEETARMRETFMKERLFEMNFMQFHLNSQYSHLASREDSLLAYEWMESLRKKYQVSYTDEEKNLNFQ